MARRLPARLLFPFARRALLAVCFLQASLAQADSWHTEPLTAARYEEPTARYPHGALGDDIEYGTLVLVYGDRHSYRIKLPETRVFEDTAPRLADVNRDGRDEAIVVESDAQQGARLAIYNGNGLIAATPYIGQRFRWLAPIAIADLDGDGYVELAYIDRPHLAKTLRIWRFQNNALTQIATAPGLTNHRLGAREIEGGMRDCGQGPELITASADWRNVMSSRLSKGHITSQRLGPYKSTTSLAQALSCP